MREPSPANARACAHCAHSAGTATPSNHPAAAAFWRNGAERHARERADGAAWVRLPASTLDRLVAAAVRSKARLSRTALRARVGAPKRVHGSRGVFAVSGWRARRRLSPMAGRVRLRCCMPVAHLPVHPPQERSRGTPTTAFFSGALAGAPRRQFVRHVMSGRCAAVGVGWSGADTMREPSPANARACAHCEHNGGTPTPWACQARRSVLCQNGAGNHAREEAAGGAWARLRTSAVCRVCAAVVPSKARRCRTALRARLGAPKSVHGSRGVLAVSGWRARRRLSPMAGRVLVQCCMPAARVPVHAPQERS